MNTRLTPEQREERAFAQGMAVAVSFLAREFDQPGMAADIIFQTGMLKEDFKSCDPFDRKWIYKLFREETRLRT